MSASTTTTSATPVWTRPAPILTTPSPVASTSPGVSQSIDDGQDDKGNDKYDDDDDDNSWLNYLKDKLDALKAWAKALLKDKESNTDPGTDENQ